MSRGALTGIALFAAFQVVGVLVSGPEEFFQTEIIGVSNGLIFALVALGYTLVYGIIELINFAHGDVFMIGSMLAFFLISILFGVTADTPVLLKIGIILIDLGRDDAGSRRSSTWASSGSPTSRCATHRSWPRSSRRSA